jgi:pimeloyl-ACP methyl ester carboxylesterase
MKNGSKILLLSCFVMLLSLYAYSQEPIVLKTGTGEIKGTLILPENKKNIPLVLIISGSGPTDRNGNSSYGGDNNSLKFLAEELSKNGIASVRFDKRGIAESADAVREEGEMRFENYVNDVKEWITLLAKGKNYSKIIIAGHSEGSLIGMVASVENKKVNAFVSIAGAGRPADEIIKEQMAKYPEKVKDIIFPMIDKIKKGDTIQNVPPMLSAMFRPGIQPYMTSWFKYEPQAEIKKLKIPILIVQGSTDIQVTETDADLLSKAKPLAEKKIIKNMNHVLKDCDTKDKDVQIPIYSNPELPLNKDFVSEVMSFIKKLK